MWMQASSVARLEQLFSLYAFEIRILCIKHGGLRGAIIHVGESCHSCRPSIAGYGQVAVVSHTSVPILSSPYPRSMLMPWRP